MIVVGGEPSRGMATYLDLRAWENGYVAAVRGLTADGCPAWYGPSGDEEFRRGWSRGRHDVVHGMVDLKGAKAAAQRRMGL